MGSQRYSRRLCLVPPVLLFVWWTILSQRRHLPGTIHASTTNLSRIRLPRHQYAYAAFLAAPEKESNSDDDDKYFIGLRIIAYSLLHDPKTRTNTSIPLLVLVTEEVNASKRARLEADGATVIPAGKLSFDWIQASRERWRDVLSKFYLFTLTQYERVLFLDSDMLIARQMDGIFQDPAARVQKTTLDAGNAPPEEGLQPNDFVYASVSGQGSYDHPFPPRRGGSCNAGFLLFRPDHALFQHYLTVAEKAVGKFNPNYPEQNLWNYVHRRKGNMPWQQLDPTWNVNWATMSDWKKGAKSLHTKWWSPGPEKELKEIALALKWKMEGNSIAIDQARGLY